MDERESRIASSNPENVKLTCIHIPMCISENLIPGGFQLYLRTFLCNPNARKKVNFEI